MVSSLASYGNKTWKWTVTDCIFQQVIHVPEKDGRWHIRYFYGIEIGIGALEIDLPFLFDKINKDFPAIWPFGHLQAPAF